MVTKWKEWRLQGTGKWGGVRSCLAPQVSIFARWKYYGDFFLESINQGYLVNANHDYQPSPLGTNIFFSLLLVHKVFPKDSSYWERELTNPTHRRMWTKLLQQAYAYLLPLTHSPISDWLGVIECLPWSWEMVLKYFTWALRKDSSTDLQYSRILPSSSFTLPLPKIVIEN